MGAHKLDRPVVLLKIGGKMAEEEASLRELALDLKDLLQAGRYAVLVHGGGAEVSRISRELGIEPLFHEGVRVTSPEEMDIVEMILCGRVGKRLVRLFQSCGLPAVGLSGADGRIFTGRPLGRILERETRTGNVERVEPGLLEVLLGAGYFPVLASTTADESGAGVNINADTVAFELACALQLSLLFLPTSGPAREQELNGLDRAGRRSATARSRGAPIPRPPRLEALKGAWAG
jgi:acetylglutamate kinase